MVVLFLRPLRFHTNPLLLCSGAHKIRRFYHEYIRFTSWWDLLFLILYVNMNYRAHHNSKVLFLLLWRHNDNNAKRDHKQRKRKKSAFNLKKKMTNLNEHETFRARLKTERNRNVPGKHEKWESSKSQNILE